MIQRIMVEVLSDCTFSYFEVSDKYKFCWCYFGELKKTRYFAGFFFWNVWFCVILHLLIFGNMQEKRNFRANFYS